MANKTLTEAIAKLGKAPEEFEEDLEKDRFEVGIKEVLQDSLRLLDRYAPSDATRIAALIGRLATDRDERMRYFDSRETVLKEAHLSRDVQAALGRSWGNSIFSIGFNGLDLIEVFAPSDATRLATLIASLTTSKKELREYDADRDGVLKRAGLSSSARKGFKEGDKKEIEKILKRQGDPGEGGQIEVVRPPD